MRIPQAPRRFVFIPAALPQLRGADWKLAPIALVTQTRVAVADGIGEALHAKMSLILIGERPGLSSPDSLGAYITWQPRVGRTDAERNCISNIRHGGLEVEAAATKIFWYLKEASRLRETGTGLKETAATMVPLSDGHSSGT